MRQKNCWSQIARSIAIVQATSAATNVRARIEQRSLAAAFDSSFTAFFDGFSPHDQTLVIDYAFFDRAKVRQEMGRLVSGQSWDIGVLEAEYSKQFPNGNRILFLENIGKFRNVFLETISKNQPLASKLNTSNQSMMTDEIVRRIQLDFERQIETLKHELANMVSSAVSKWEDRQIASESIADRITDFQNNLSDTIRASGFEDRILEVMSNVPTYNLLCDAIYEILDGIKAPIEAKYHLVRLIDKDALDHQIRVHFQDSIDTEEVIAEVSQLLRSAIDFDMLTEEILKEAEKAKEHRIPDKEIEKVVYNAIHSSTDLRLLNTNLVAIMGSHLPTDEQNGKYIGDALRSAILDAIPRLRENHVHPPSASVSDIDET